MEIKEVHTNLELRIAYLCAYHTDFLFEVASEYKRGLLQNLSIERLVYLCINYYNEYNEAPKERLDEIVDNCAGLGQISESVFADISVILNSFKNQANVTDIDFEISEAYKYFTKQSIELLTGEAQQLAEEGKLKEAVKLLSEVIPIERKRLEGGDILTADDSEIDELFFDMEERLIELTGELGKIMNNTLVRNGFVSLFGRNKVGKSHWLIYLARMARNQGNKVIFFSTGDMTRKQCEMRILQGDGATTRSEHYRQNQRIPVLDCKKNQTGECFERDGRGDLLDDFNNIFDPPIIEDDGYKPCTKCDKWERVVSYKKVERPLLTADTAKKLRDKWKELDKGGVLHVEAFTSGSLTCAGMTSAVNRICKMYDWDRPDVVILDYADIMANEARDERASVNKRWTYLRGFSDMFDCLLITATQANSSSFDFEDLTLRAFTEDRRKLDHVTAFFAINQRPEERSNDIWRIAALNKREHPFNEANQAKCYGCLSMGTPHIISHYEYSKPPQAIK